MSSDPSRASSPPDAGGADAPDSRPPGGAWQAEGPRASRRRWLIAGRLLSFAVVLVALRWVFLRLGADGAALAAYRPSKSFLIALLCAVPLLAAVELVPAYAWHRLLVILGGSGPQQRRRNLLIHTKMQVARYLPGHAFQVGRHALSRQASPGRRADPHSALAAAATCETVGMIAGAAVLVLLGFGAAFGDGALNLGSVVPQELLRWAPMLAVALVVSIPLLLARLAGSRLLPGVVQHRPRDSFRVFGLYSLYFAVHGLVFGILLTFVRAPEHDWKAALVAGAAAFPLAWVIGFLTPATPAGAGATEAVLVAVLGARYGAVEVLAAAVGARAASVTAHGLMALAASWLETRLSEPGCESRSTLEAAKARGVSDVGISASKVTT